MNTIREEKINQLHKVWRTAREEGWTASEIQLTIGWLVSDQQARAAISQNVLNSGWSSAPPEDYGPEANPLEFIAFMEFSRPSLSTLEHNVDWAVGLAAEYRAEVSRIGLSSSG